MKQIQKEAKQIRNQGKNFGGVNFTANGEEPSSDLDWGEIENCGTGREVEQFWRNNEETKGYEDSQTPKDVEVFKISAKENPPGWKWGESTQFAAIWQKVDRFFERKEEFSENASKNGKFRGGKKPFGGEQTRLSKMEGLESKGDFEQRRSGWNSSENKASCFECGNTDRFKAQCPIWIKRKKSG